MEIKNLALDKLDFGEFKVDEIFNIENCKCSKVSDLKSGLVPYVGATNRNNGVIKFVENKPELITDGNSVAFICDGEGSIGYSIYKSESFIGSTTVKVGRNETLNKYNAMFITTVADTVRGKYNFGYKRNDNNLRKEMLLPIDKDGNPNWQFMEDYMRMQEKKLLDKAVKKLEGKILSNLIITGSLSECRWKEFSFTEVFNKIQRGKRLTKADQLMGNTPYISSTALNNGVDGFIGNEDNVRKFQNCITLANSGSVGNAFFQQYEFVASDHVTQLKCDQADKYSYLFMLPIISRLSEKYSFNREINDERIKREKLLLPVNEEEEIDFVFMSNFMKNLETETLQNVLKIYNNRLQKQNKLTNVNGGG